MTRYLTNSKAPPGSVQPRSIAQWRAWLRARCERHEGVWLVMLKKGAGSQRLDYDEVVVEAISFGWIDSKPRSLDATRSMLWFAPRKAGSGWSRRNKERVARAINEKRMAAAGLAKVKQAKRDGTWGSLDAVEALRIPPDLRRALAARKPADSNFGSFPRSVKRSILEWIGHARTAPTRARRIEETARLAQKNLRANQWKG